MLPLAGLTLAATLALAACSGDPEEPADDGGTGATDAAPTEESTAPSEESPSADDTESSPDNTEGSEGSDSDDEHVPASADEPAQNVPMPEMPDEATRKSEEGVEAAVEYFWAADSYLVSTGDPNPLDSVSSDTCNFCAEEIDYFTAIYSEDSWYVSTPDEVTNVDPSITGDNSAEAIMTMNSTASAMYYDDGTKAGSEATTYDVGWLIKLRHNNDNWVITEATAIEGSGSKGSNEGSDDS